MTINATAIILLSLYIAVARRQGVAASKLSGTTQNDILKEYVARGTYIYPPRPSLRIVTDIFAFCERELPAWNTISISGYHIREAGSTAIQEVAFTFAHGIAYVQAAIDAGLDVNQFGQRISFFFNAHNDFLEEIAKFRAARRLWATIMRDRFGATHPRAQQLRFHTQTAGSTLTAQQPDNNIVRVAVQAMAAVLGGTQSLHCNGRDEALGLPTEEAARLALRTQQIIASETGVANTVDPVGGSYAIEQLTDRDRSRRRRAARADRHRWAERSRRSRAGSSSAKFRSPRIGRRWPSIRARPSSSASIASWTMIRVSGQDRPCFGLILNREAARPIGSGRSAPAETRCLAAGASTRSRRRHAMDRTSFRRIIAAVEAKATVGEIADAMRSVFGEYREAAAL